MSHLAPSIAEVYRDARSAGAVFDLSDWTVMRLRGPDTRPFLQGLATADLESGTAARVTFFLSEKGRAVALAWARVSDDGQSAWVVADDGARAGLRPHLERFRVMEDVELEGPDGMPRVLGAVGDRGRAWASEASRSIAHAVLLDTQPLSLLLVPGDASPADAPACLAPAAFEAWRIAAGLPRTGVDFDLERIATEVDYPDAISMTKGCFVGQEVVARTSNRGQVRRRRVGFRFPWSGGPIPPKAEIRAEGKTVGYVTSAILEPGTDDGLGMGYLATGVESPVLDAVAPQGDRSWRLRILPWPL